jgi:hypothetical protein
MYLTIFFLSQTLHRPKTFRTVSKSVQKSFEVEFVPSPAPSSNAHHNIFQYILLHYLHVVTTSIKLLALNSIFSLQVLRDRKVSRSYPFKNHHYRSSLQIQPFISKPISMHLPYIPHDPYSCTYTFFVTPIPFSNLPPNLHLS